jgi:Putative sensor
VTEVGGLRLAVSSAPWRCAAYLLGSMVIGTVLFSAVVTVIAVSASLLLVGIGVPLLVLAAHLIRAAAHLERQRAALVPGVEVVEDPIDHAGSAHGEDGGAVPADGPTVGDGLFAALRRRWTDPRMAPSLGYLVGLYVPLLVLDTVVSSLWLGALGGITIPLWYWAVPQTFDGVTQHGLFWGSFPHGPGGPDAVGLAIDDLPTAIGVAALFGVLFVVVACPLVVATARLHARIAGRLLGRPADPLAPARAVLRSPGPLAQLASGRSGAAPAGRSAHPAGAAARPHHLTLAPPAT